MLWDTDFGEGHEEILNEEDEESDGEDIDESDFCQPRKKREKIADETISFEGEEDDMMGDEGNIFEEDIVEAGDEFMAVKPWIGAIREPSGFIKPKQNFKKKPRAAIAIDYVYGYRSKDCRNNLRYLANGNIVYHAAALGIVMDIASNTQRFFVKHDDDITALALHPSDGVTVATGQIGPKPMICVWNSNTMQCIKKFKGHLKRGIACLAFS